jgi:hypothetical protein
MNQMVNGINNLNTEGLVSYATPESRVEEGSINWVIFITLRNNTGLDNLNLEFLTPCFQASR